MRKRLNKNKLQNNCYVKEAENTDNTKLGRSTNKPQIFETMFDVFSQLQHEKKKINISFSAQW